MFFYPLAHIYTTSIKIYLKKDPGRKKNAKLKSWPIDFIRSIKRMYTCVALVLIHFNLYNQETAKIRRKYLVLT